MTAPIVVFTLRETAAALRMSERTLREHLKRLRFRKAGGRWLFTSAETSALYEAIKCRSNSSNVATPGTSQVRNLTKVSAEVRELLTANRRKPSSPKSAKKFSIVTHMVRKP